MAGAEDSQSYRRRSGDSGLSKFVMPVLLGLLSTATVGAFTFAWSTSKDVALLKASRQVSPEDFAGMKVQIQSLQREDERTHEDIEKEFERLRSWMRSHSHNRGARASEVEQP